MAQFDTLIIFPLIFSLILSLVSYYYVSIKITIPNFFEVKKFRKKTLKSSFFFYFLKTTTFLIQKILTNKLFFLTKIFKRKIMGV